MQNHYQPHPRTFLPIKCTRLESIAADMEKHLPEVTEMEYMKSIRDKEMQWRKDHPIFHAPAGFLSMLIYAYFFSGAIGKSKTCF